jgi:hypothetical protein
MRAFILKRLREPSTWAGLAAVAGIVLPPGLETVIASGACAVLGILLPEAKAE